MSLQQIITGHCIDVMRELPANSIQVSVTSPPYFAVRDYKTEPVVWKGSAPGCEHEWGAEQPGHRARWGDTSTLSDKQRSNRGSEEMVAALERKGGQFCRSCTAWKGELGQEPNSDLYIRHLVQVFREVRRVLHPTGLLFLNLGDSRAGSGKGRMKDGTHSKEHGTVQGTNTGTLEGLLTKTAAERAPRSPLGIPDRVKEALVEDGWILVSAIVLVKKNPMTTPARGPRWVNHYLKVKKSDIEGSGKQAEIGGVYTGFNERWKAQKGAQAQAGDPTRDRTRRPCSGGLGATPAPAEVDGEPAKWVRCPGCKQCEPHGGRVLKNGGGRPTDAYEMLYAFAKTTGYFWNTEAVRRPLAESSIGRAQRYKNAHEKYGTAERPSSKHREGGVDENNGCAGFASGRSTNPYNAAGGNALSWMTWQPAPLKDKHYAAYPPFLPDWAIRAGTPEWCCARCGIPYAPVIDGDTHDEEEPAADDLANDLVEYDEDEPQHQPTLEQFHQSALDWKRACGGDANGEYHGQAQKDYEEHGAQNASDVKRRILDGMKKRTVVDWWPVCKCDAKHGSSQSYHEFGMKHENLAGCRYCGVTFAQWSFDIDGQYERCRVKPKVLDPFVGSGTTLKVAAEKGLPAVGIDAQPAYEPIARKRLAEVAA